jgi:hypothetical protein
MNATEILEIRLHRLEAEVNAAGRNKIQFCQERVQRNSMSFIGGNGLLYVTLSFYEFDISLSGKSLQTQMYPFMRDLCGKECDGYKQTKKLSGRRMCHSGESGTSRS